MLLLLLLLVMMIPLHSPPPCLPAAVQTLQLHPDFEAAHTALDGLARWNFWKVFFSLGE